jgi:hypothetical protein
VAPDDRWHVRLALDPAEVEAIRVAMYAVLSPEQWEVRLPDIPGEEAPVLSIEVRTAKQEDAEQQARDVYAEAREAAQLRPCDAEVLGALSPIFAAAPHDRLLGEAATHIEQKRFELAVVRAQTACEVYARLALDRIARDVAEPGTKPSSLFRSVSLRDRSDRALFLALTGFQIGAERWWGSYRAHVERRNEIIHAGISVTDQEAMGSMVAAEAFIAFLQARWHDASAGVAGAHPSPS